MPTIKRPIESGGNALLVQYDGLIVKNLLPDPVTMDGKTLAPGSTVVFNAGQSVVFHSSDDTARKDALELTYTQPNAPVVELTPGQLAEVQAMILASRQDPQVPPDVTLKQASLQTISIMDEGGGDSFDIVAKRDDAGVLRLWVVYPDGSQEQFVSGLRARSGAGVPSDATGRNADFYVDTAGGGLYQRVDGQYVFIAKVASPWLETANPPLNLSNDKRTLSIDTSAFATLAAVDGKITAALGPYAKTADLMGLAKTSDLSIYAKSSDLTGLAKTSDLGVYALKTDLGPYAKTSDLTPYAKTADLSGLATTAYVDSKYGSIPSYTPSVTAPITFVNGKIGFDDSAYAKTSALSGYATTASLTTTLQGYVTTTTLANYSTTAQMSAAINAAKPIALLSQTFTTPAIGLLGTPAKTDYTVNGAAVGMNVQINPRSSTPLGPMLYAWVSAANTVSVEVRPLVAIAAGSIQIDIRVFP